MQKHPFLVIIDGPMGAGKSTVSKLIHKKIKYSALLSLDRIKHIISGVKVDDLEHLQLASEIGAVMTKEYLKRGKNVIVEKAFTKEEYLKDFLKQVNYQHSEIFIYQIEAPLKLRIERVKGRDSPEGIKTKPTLKKIKKNHENYNNFKYKNAKIFDSSRLTAIQIVNQILKDLN
ncbi:MAG: AAA family ATPase [Candidatus Pacearchaeota archaeon]